MSCNNHAYFWVYVHLLSLVYVLITIAGFPTTIEKDGIVLCITLPADIIEPLLIKAAGNTVAPDRNQTSSSIITGVDFPKVFILFSTLWKDRSWPFPSII
jgi:hypothetical protein